MTLPWAKRHQSINFEFGSKEGILAIPAGTRAHASLAAARMESPKKIEHLAADCKPIATRSKNYSIDDQRFISSEVQRLLSEDIIKACSLSLASTSLSG